MVFSHLVYAPMTESTQKVKTPTNKRKRIPASNNTPLLTCLKVLPVSGLQQNQQEAVTPVFHVSCTHFSGAEITGSGQKLSKM